MRGCCVTLITRSVLFFVPPLSPSLSLLLLLAGLPFAILNIRHTPFRRGFFCSDDSIRYPYKEDTITYQLLGGVMIPVLVLTVSASLVLAAYTCAFHVVVVFMVLHITLKG